MVQNGENFIFTKFGDGEIACMKRPWWGRNVDGDRYHRWLSRSLVKAFVNLAGKPNAYIGLWHDPTMVKYLEKLAKRKRIESINWVHYHTVMNASPVANTTDYDSFKNSHMLQFVQAVRTSKRNKIILSNSDNARMKLLFQADSFVETPKNNWSFEYSKYLEIVQPLCTPDTILITAAGLCSKVLISDLSNKFDMTLIDVGSGFDLLVTRRHSRPWGHSYEDEVRYYGSILPDDW